MLTDNQETRDALSRAWAVAERGRLWHAVIAKANELAGDTIRVVRCPEVEVVGEIADPVAMHGKRARIVYIDNGGDLFIARASELNVAALVRWCSEEDLARDPKTAVWHERTMQRVRRWDAASVPEPERRVVLYHSDDSLTTVSCDVPREATAARWNRLGDVTHWHYAPDAERAE